ncbi:MAG: hypothetical protein HN374_01420 [Cryomorphaceae bacterium]|jgi:hypothetical protein|nr:hypothetical protein [Cryomorphaceae bacterium]
MIIIDNKIIEINGDTEKITKFVERWISKSKEIRELSLDANQAYTTTRDFLDEIGFIFPTIAKVDDKNNKCLFLFEQISNDLRFSLKIAYNKYRKENKSFWRIFFEKNLKLPDINLIKNSK